MAKQDVQQTANAAVPITGRRLRLPPGPVFTLRTADQSDYEIGEFRAWAGYKNLGSDEATNDLAHFQHVLSFAGTEAAGRTGIHAHLAHVHVVIPTSGRAVFSYDGVVTEAAPGSVIVQHGGTVHDQYDYSYAPASEAENRRTPQSIEPTPADGPAASFGFLELFVPKIFANVEIVAPGEVTTTDQHTAWGHPYHLPGARFFLQDAGAPGAAYRPVATRPDLEARDAETWWPSAGMVATWILRCARDPASSDLPPIVLEVPGEQDGIEILYMINGSALFARGNGEKISLSAGDTLTHSQAMLGLPFRCSPDMQLIRFLVASRTQLLRERTADEIHRVEELGPGIITDRQLRAEDDRRPVNFLSGGDGPAT